MKSVPLTVEFIYLAPSAESAGRYVLQIAVKGLKVTLFTNHMPKFTFDMYLYFSTRLEK